MGSTAQHPRRKPYSAPHRTMTARLPLSGPGAEVKPTGQEAEPGFPALTGAAGVPTRLTRLRVLPAGGAADRPQPRLPIRRAQALPTRLAHPARARRRGARSDRDAGSRGGDRRRSLTPPISRACPSSRRWFAVGSRMGPAASAAAGRPLKTERPRRQSREQHPINHLVAGLHVRAPR
jgi:hypothetical protein